MADIPTAQVNTITDGAGATCTPPADGGAPTQGQDQNQPGDTPPASGDQPPAGYTPPDGDGKPGDDDKPAGAPDEYADFNMAEGFEVITF